MNDHLSRRRFIQWSAASTFVFHSPLHAQTNHSPTYDGKLGLLLGGLIGDALGGPVEFSEASAQEQHLVGARQWDADRQITDEDLTVLAATIPLLGYEKLRPDTSPYGPWQRSAKAGTLTDDSRHKIILIHAIARAKKRSRSVTPQDIAKALLDFRPVIHPETREAMLALDEAGFREYRYAARWLLGERDLQLARPIERLWAGINNCSGQMMLPPLAVAYAGEPLEAYKKAYEIDFIDAPLARDIAASFVAGLAAAIAPALHDADPNDRWNAMLAAMRNTDPFDYAAVPFAGRPLHRWLDKADELVQRAEAHPKQLYRLLETEGKPVYWWDAHFTLLVPLCMLKFCNFNPMAAMHLTLDFGHDTDSYAQVLGCMAGAAHGSTIFPTEMRDAVAKTLKSDYAEDVNQWLDVLVS